MVVSRIFGKLLETQPGFHPWWMGELDLQQRRTILAELATEVADYVEEGDRPEVVGGGLEGPGLVLRPREWTPIVGTGLKGINESDHTIWLGLQSITDEGKDN